MSSRTLFTGFGRFSLVVALAAAGCVEDPSQVKPGGSDDVPDEVDGIDSMSPTPLDVETSTPDDLFAKVKTEVCNGIDDDYDGKIDEGFDFDGDGWVECNAEGCTRTIGYWKTHHKYASNPSQRDPWPLSEDQMICGKRWVDQIQLQGGLFDQLTSQYIAAKLNGADGASVPPAISSALSSVQSILADCQIKLTEKTSAEYKLTLLDEYNNGNEGPPHCDDATCGDGSVDPGEACDDGNSTGGDGCENDCSLTPEICDGKDNDKDGKIDEGFDSDADGIADCYDVEVCDGKDNDGDGKKDEGFDSDADGLADCFDTETCDGKDNDGDGQKDEGIDSDADGIADCFDTEQCDGKDNDGDGSVDEGFDSDFDGIANCFDTEVCDHLDNDGDGQTDEGFDVDNDGVVDCDDTEVCDGKDNDGDGGVDEGFDADRDGLADCFDKEECDGKDNDGDGATDEGFDSDGDGIANCFDTETCDGKDNDGDGLKDEGFDADNDGIADCFDAEVCDGKDNDGDGSVDEGFDSDNDGIANCYDTETCDGKDNDGDGDTDEGFDSDADGIADCYDTEVCDGKDNDGDGVKDEGFDADNDGTPDCYDVEQCDGKDNDGDGAIDEGFDADNDGTADCYDTEVCDGKDNDGDGAIDEDFDNDGDGTANCYDTETCDGVDNDGDGQIDEGFDSDADGTADCFDTEVCDRKDNDGDGWIDEGFDVDSDGTPDCSDIEECDGVDNDGDGHVDEGFDVDLDGTNDCDDVEECDGIDNDGDFEVDEDEVCGCVPANVTETYRAVEAYTDGHGGGSGGHAIWAPGFNDGNTGHIVRLRFRNDVRFQIEDDGEATLTGTAYVDSLGGSVGVLGEEWTVDARWTYRGTGAAGVGSGGPKLELNAGWQPASFVDTWRYFDMVEGTFTQVIGGDVVSLVQAPAGSVFPLQLGDRANNKNLNFGLSTWFFGTRRNSSGQQVCSTWMGDFNLDLIGLDPDTCEACDGIDNDGDGQVDEGFDADGNGEPDCEQVPVCGDDTVDPDEECDDGNHNNDDGCSADCQIELCGDGVLQSGEECDDSNFFDGDGCDHNCEPEPPICIEDLGVAGTYNVFVFGNFTGALDVEGKVAAGGFVDMASFSIGFRDQGGTALVAGAMKLRSGHVWGDTFYGSSADVTPDVTIEGVFENNMPIDFPTAEADLTEFSEELCLTYEYNGDTFAWNDGDETRHIALIGSHPTLNVFEVQATDLAITKDLWITAPEGSHVLVNIIGEEVAAGDFGVFLNGVDASDILWNACEATTVDLYQIAWQGSLLAPFAHVTFNNGNFAGTLVAASAEGTGEYHRYDWDGGFLCP